MDWHIAVMLLAIAVTYLAWRRVRRANELDRARTAALEEARWTYRLEPDSNAHGRGYVVKTAHGAELDRDTLSWSTHGIEVVVVDRTRADAGALSDEAFAPGSGIRLTTAGTMRSRCGMIPARSD